jgi:hypothetical protein
MISMIWAVIRTIWEGMQAAAIVLILLMAAAGCTTTTQKPTIVEKIVERKVEIPPSLLECMPEPKAQEVWAMQRDVALFMEKLALAGADCRTRLAKVRKLLAD